jgi:hypothetical protein
VIVGENAIALAIQRPQPRPALVIASAGHHGPELTSDAAKRLDLPDPLENLPALAARSGFKVHSMDNRDARHWRQAGAAYA